MATKWRNRFHIGIWAILLTFGLSGVLTLFTSGTRYIHRDYFHTPEFQNELDQFTGDLSMFELNSKTAAEAKKAITVTNEEMNEYRNQNGDLNLQIANIKEQYDSLIQQADTKEEANIYKTERDKKIMDITNNFSNDDYIKNKVKQEKEQKLDEYFKEREGLQAEYLQYIKGFRYYFKNRATGKAYTNLSDGEASKINSKEMLYVTKYTINPENAIYAVPGYEDLMNSIIPKTNGTFDGQIAVPKSPSSANPIMDEYNGYKIKQIFLLVYALVSISTLIFLFYFRKKSKVIPVELERWGAYYNKLPIDVRAVFFLLSVIGFILFLFTISNQFPFLTDNLLVFLKEIFICLVFGSIFCAVTLLQWNYLTSVIKDIKNQWEKALFTRAVVSLKEIFLHQPMGNQLIIILATAYFLGLASVLILAERALLPFYIILLLAIGIPIMVIMTKRLAYLNKIVEKSNELAAGKMGKDLQVSGKTVLATLAANINTLKQGVKTSQNAQAKSERLKTELITNVSHDLRTPLTSIITYTQLLKTEDISSEDRTAYLEIIDRKSKRLKVLIDDLFEVSKMASGNMELKKEKVDLVQLLQQSLAEYDDKITDSSLQFRVTKSEKPIYAFVDGQKLWRVFDNLIGNILKYSLDHTRVYITVSTMNSQANISFKNISKYELNENSDELFERFKRGDTSRHTDGTGLGLAIAKSIVDLHEGSLDIETDGDLFKVNISLRIQ